MYMVCLTATSMFLLLAFGTCHAQAPVRVGEVIFQTDFEGPNPFAGWSGQPKIEQGYQSAQSMAIEAPLAGQARSVIASIPLPVEKVRACLLHFSGMIKAQDVSQKPNPWNGIKFMAPIVTPTTRLWPQASVGVGSFDWQRFTFAVRVPQDATQMSLYLGLELVTGKVWFDDITVTVRKPPFVPKPPVEQTGPVYKGHPLPRLRGTMVSPRIDDESLRVLGQEWNANVIRWQLSWWRPKGRTFDLAAYDAWLHEQLALLDAALPLCRKYGLYVVVDLHSPPAGGDESGKNLFTEPACQQKFIDNWKMMAAKYKDSQVVWGYDLVNEPVEGAVAEGCYDWQELAEITAKAIREIDKTHAIIVEPPDWGNPSALAMFNPIDVPGVVYSVHMYLPHSFTHQGVHGEWTNKYVYPGEIDGKMWDKAQLQAALQPVVDFQRRYKVHIFIGEFSAIRWAPDNSAYRYLKDLIDIFEANNWDWTYHAFREWHGWSVEHGPDRDITQPAATPTDRQRLLLDWFSRNVKPPWYGA